MPGRRRARAVGSLIAKATSKLAPRHGDAPYSVLAGGTVTVPYRACELFLTCMRPAVHMVRHPILRDLVPTCTECVERLGLSDRVIPDACA